MHSKREVNFELEAEDPDISEKIMAKKKKMFMMNQHSARMLIK